MQPLFLKIVHRGKLVKIQPFTEDQISIGSGEGLSLQLKGLSPWHLLIERKLDKYTAFDLGSEMGTLLQGEKLVGEKEIQSGSFLVMGEYQIQFFVGVPKDTTSKVPDIQASKQKSKERIPEPPKPQPDKKLAEPVSTPKTRPVTPKQPLVSSKPKQGFWGTFAPPSKIQDLDSHLQASIGNFIEVVVAWKERILSVHHFMRGDVHLGSSSDCEIPVPNLLDINKYKVAEISKEARVFFSHGVTGKLFQGKDQSTRTSLEIKGVQNFLLKPYEMLRLDFQHALSLYVRLKNKPVESPPKAWFFLQASEWLVLFLSCLLTGLLVIYSALYAPFFLADKDLFVEENLRQAVVRFVSPKPAKIVKKLAPKSRVAKRKGSKTSKKKRAFTPRRKAPVALSKKTKPKAKKVSVKTLKPKSGGKPGGLRGRKTKQPRAGSLRPGGSLKTGKQASGAKTKAPDPSKVGMLGVFGSGGRLKKLDKGATGSGGLLGLADKATGFSGTQEAYDGEGIGTSTKALGSGGQGSSIVGVGGIKTKGQGSLTPGKGTGKLGRRGQMQLDIGDDDIEVESGVDREAILRVLRANKNRFSQCYQFSLQQDSSIKGNIKMQWDILSRGSVDGVITLNNGTGSEKLAGCVGVVLKSLRFPQPPSGQKPRISFKFGFFQ